MRVFLICIIVLAFFNPLPSVELKRIDTVPLTGGGEDDFIKIPSGFVITEDQLYIVPDRKEGDLKIFDIKGKFVKRIGRKGHGPNEFISPGVCDYYNRRLIILDMDKRAFLLYARDKDTILKEYKILRSMTMGSDVSMMKDDQVLFDGCLIDKDGTTWDGYTYNFNTEKYNRLITTHQRHGYPSFKAYQNAKIDEINPIGFSGYCEWWGDYAYYVWLGDLKMFKVNMKTKKIETFGKKTANFRQPIVTDDLKKAHQERDVNTWAKLIKNVSQIRGLFANKDWLILAYEKILEKGEEVQQRMVQFYTHEGELVNEMILPSGGPCGLFLSKDRDDGILYMLNRVPEKENSDDWDDERWQITRFKMIK